MRRDDIAAAFNEWMRRYTEDPDRFKWEWQTTTEFVSQQQAGQTPSYGATCAAYLQKLIDELKMSLSPVEQLVAKHEGFRRTVYTDTRGKLTIGYGFNLSDPTAIATCDLHGLNLSSLLNGEPIAEIDARAIMCDKILEAKFSATKIFPDFDALPDKVKMVVQDMLYQMGEPVFREFRGTIAAINEGKFDVAANRMRQLQWFAEVPARAVENCSLMEDAALGITG